MPRPMVVIDRREQRPYTFPSGRVTTIPGTLPAGDYSVVGLEGQVAIERKSLADFVNTVVGDRDRWARELAKLRGYRMAVVVVEADSIDIRSGRWQGGARPATVESAIIGLTAEWPVKVLLAGDRATAERWTEALLLRAAAWLAPPQGDLPGVPR